MKDSNLICFHPYKGEKIPKDFEYDDDSKPLVDFFNKKAKSCTKELVSKVFVIRDQKRKFIGFIATSIKALDKGKLKKSKSRGLFDRPSIVIGQLLIDKKYQGKGYGTKAISWVILIAKTLGKFLPFRLLFVEAINDKAKEFYEKRGFKALPKDPYTLVLDLTKFMNN